MQHTLSEAGERVISLVFTFGPKPTEPARIPSPGGATPHPSPRRDPALPSREGPTGGSRNLRKAAGALLSPLPPPRTPEPRCQGSAVGGRRAARPPSRRIPTVRHFWKRQKGQRLRCVLSILQLWLSVHV